MSSTPPEPGSVARWLQYAAGDLALAEHSAGADVPHLLRCFHAQQAAEKSLKAVLLDCGVEFPPTHNLSTLLALLPEGVEPPEQRAAIAGLSVYAVSARYPDEIDEATEAELAEAAVLARAALLWAERSIGGAGRS